MTEINETPDPAYRYEPVVLSSESTVVAEYEPDQARQTAYQSEADLEAQFIATLGQQAYEYVEIRSEDGLKANLRRQLETLNSRPGEEFAFSDTEWKQFFDEVIASSRDGITEKTKRIQTDHIQVLKRDDGTTRNILLLDKQSIHSNRLQVINQYDITGASATGAPRANRYDVTILVNGLPMVHVELKRRGVDIREAFNQIDRYQRDSFWAGSGLFEYVQLFVISNGTHTKYYSNTTRRSHLDEAKAKRSGKRRTSNSFEFTSWWADFNNVAITDLVDFTKTFFAKHTLLNILTKYCVFDVSEKLLVMRPYQIAATEQILQRIATSSTYKRYGTTAAGGFIWHTTGSGKTLTSFKTAQLAAGLPGVEKVMFVVDRKDLDYQTMREFNRFEPGAVNGSKNTAALRRQLEDPSSRIIVTTIQKLSNFIAANKGHEIYTGQIVMIFDECHRSQFGDMHTAITKAFKRWHLFGFTGTPIFAENAASSGNPQLRTTEQAFGDKLHTYTIVDAINDRNVLPFRVDYVRTVKLGPDGDEMLVSGIDAEKALLDAKRISDVVTYIRTHFNQKTRRNSTYRLDDRRLAGFNSLFATASITAAKTYYAEFKRQQADMPSDQRLKVGLIYSFAANEDADGFLDEEGFETEALDASSRDFLDGAIADYNQTFNTSYDTSGDGFQNYYKDLSRRLKERELDLVIVVNMFLTGFDATTLNTLWVDKNLRQHGLIQAFSRTNRILNSVKSYGNIVTFRNLEKATNDALALFGNKEARGIVLLKPYAEYYATYAEKVTELLEKFPVGEEIVGEGAKKEFIGLFGRILRLRNILTSFDEFAGNEIISSFDLQNYQSTYLDLHAEFRKREGSEKESINDDVVFEIELVKQVEVNVDYILMLVDQWRAEKGNGSDREMDALLKIQSAIDASPSLRNKRELIMEFVDRVSPEDEVGEEWLRFINARRQADLEAIITAENLKPVEANRFIDAAFRDGLLPTGGTAITKILPPVSRFAKGNNHAVKKQRVFDRLDDFFNRYVDLTGITTVALQPATASDDQDGEAYLTYGAGGPITRAEAEYFERLKGKLPVAEVTSQTE